MKSNEFVNLAKKVANNYKYAKSFEYKIDGERHSLLTKSNAKGADWIHTYPRILHLDGRFITKIHLEFVTAF